MDVTQATLIRRICERVWSQESRKYCFNVDREDAVSQAFTKCLTYSHRWDASLGSENTYFSMIARDSIKQLNFIERRVSKPLVKSLDFSYREGGPTMSDGMAADNGDCVVERQDEVDMVREAMSRLTPDQREAVLASTEFNAQEDLAKRRGVSQQAVSRMGLLAMKKMRSYLARKKL